LHKPHPKLPQNDSSCILNSRNKKNNKQKTMKDQVYGYFMPMVNLMGFGSAKKVGEQMKLTGKKKAFIVTDEGVMKAGIADMIKENIEESGLSAVIWD